MKKISNPIVIGFAKRALQRGLDPDEVADIIRKYFGINEPKQPDTSWSTAHDLIDEGGVNSTNNIV